MDRMRESMFNILGDIGGCSFLDLFSGSGVVGIEAASRGCEPVYLVEKDRNKRTTIQKNISFVESEVTILTMSVERFIHQCRRRFSIIFVDPPFAYHEKEKLLEQIVSRSIPETNGLILIHYPREEKLPESIRTVHRIDRRTFGRSVLDFFRADDRDG